MPCKGESNAVTFCPQVFFRAGDVIYSFACHNLIDEVPSLLGLLALYYPVLLCRATILYTAAKLPWETVRLRQLLWAQPFWTANSTCARNKGTAFSIGVLFTLWTSSLRWPASLIICLHVCVPFCRTFQCLYWWELYDAVVECYY